MNDSRPNTMLLDKAFDEANTLLVEARDYVKWQAPLDVECLAPIDRLKVSCESMRVTARLTQVMAWIMLQKAVYNGEITQEMAREEALRVLKSQSCVETDGEHDHDIPPRLRLLLKDSFGLYMRILRLDDQCRKGMPSPSDIKKLTDPRH